MAEFGERLWADYQEFIHRDLGEYEISDLLVDGIAERLRPGQRRKAVLAANDVFRPLTREAVIAYRKMNGLAA